MDDQIRRYLVYVQKFGILLIQQNNFEYFFRKRLIHLGTKLKLLLIINNNQIVDHCNQIKLLLAHCDT